MPAKKTVTKRPPMRPRNKNNPVIALTGSPPPAKQTWWSQKFIEVLESFKMGSRLARGKAYAQEAKVLKLSISSGIVTSTVQGSRKAHYKVSIKLVPLSDNAWNMVMQNLTKKAIYAVDMLQDRMPKQIEDAFTRADVSLFPSKLEDLESSCDCPDWSNPCKHIAATYYILAQHFDLDPFLIFVWRGRLKTQILDFLRGHWKQGKPRTAAFGGMPTWRPTPEEYERYWMGSREADPLTPLDPFSKAVPDSSLKKFGPSPVQLDERDLADVLAECYQETSQRIRAWAAFSEGAQDPSNIVIPASFFAKRSSAG
jgi:uncharacterized Zn finger protein